MKTQLHPNSRFNSDYHFATLTQIEPELANFIFEKHNKQTLDFADPLAVKLLNKALLKAHYQIEFWDIPEHYLCPAIPGRADYIHYIADLLNGASQDRQIKGLDIGTGASCVYPIIGVGEYNWQFVGTDIDPISVKTAQMIVKSNPPIGKKIEVRQQKQADHIFTGVIKKGEQFAFSMCNPPFHKSLAEAFKGNQRKIKNLTGKTPAKSQFNFGGQQAELWCKGGEIAFVSQMITESQAYAENIQWFTCLISKKENIKPLQKRLQQVKAKQVRVIDMAQGNKVSRILAWCYT
ncbi:23S rRNA (adenine(1618)-N(6))-methyltransferase RlmF [Saccharobesus litoralis]|uniref:23S rRNA (adenine(1618)-N(6))-methyltransferase RlmF n=1 Tax=Saccharobesus litoralis TaxID=2172099 RepID=UPI001E549742|nr:23S rRNA (adenine(1618)-N(6))-methyltransferase RlmF [Saccharobesus litoralis]